MRRVKDRIRISAAVLALWLVVASTVSLGALASSSGGVAARSTGGLASLLKEAAGTSGCVGQEVTSTTQPDEKCDENGTNMTKLVDHLLTQALVITVILAPLAMAWGAGTMLFSTRGSGPQMIGASIVAVVLVAGAKGIAL